MFVIVLFMLFGFGCVMYCLLVRVVVYVFDVCCHRLVADRRWFVIALCLFVTCLFCVGFNSVVVVCCLYHVCIYIVCVLCMCVVWLL